MIYRKLGRTGLNVSAIALGCEGFSGKKPEDVVRDFDFAENAGINFFDLYASNPDLRSALGAAIKGRRDKFIIQGHLCSIWEKGQYLRSRNIDKTKHSFDDLLTRLGTDYVDVGMIHYIDAEKDFHKVFDGEIVKLAQQYKREGKIHFIGMSSHNPKVAQMAVETGIIDVLMFSINPCYDMQPATEVIEDLWAEDHYKNALQNIDADREKLYETCERLGVGIDVMKVYGGGDILNELDSPFGKALTPVQAINYALTRPAVAAVMVGCKSTAEMKSAIDWCSATDKEKDYASAISTMKKFTWKGHCMYCGHCAPCTSGIDIASVNKFYNLAKPRNSESGNSEQRNAGQCGGQCSKQSAVPETVREHYKLLAHHASECVKCGGCETRCPFGVKIIEGMEKAAELFGY
jgi:predicted aldo/keto reductase-like oxidoreductase